MNATDERQARGETAGDPYGRSAQWTRDGRQGDGMPRQDRRDWQEVAWDEARELPQRFAGEFDAWQQRAARSSLPNTLGAALGWFSLGLGLLEVAAPRQVAEWIGIDPYGMSTAKLRAFGAREIASGAGLLTQQNKTPWLWSRIVGDGMDLAFLTSEMRRADAERGRVSGATAAVAGNALLDALAISLDTKAQEARFMGAYADENSWERRRIAGAAAPPQTGLDLLAEEKGTEVREAITVGRSPEEVYAFWRNFENLPRFLQHLESVTTTGATTSHWKAKAPAGFSVEWDAEILEDAPNQRIMWQSVANADVDSAGSVEFKPAPGDKGTEVIVSMRYNPPAGKLGAWVAKLFGEEPSQTIAADLRRFKQVMEVGYVPRSEATLRNQKAAQPPE